MVVGSKDKCDICHMEYDKSTDEKECLAKVEHCFIMKIGSVN